jgi:hypothetical protein
MDKLLHGDSLEVLKTLEDESVDLLCTDLQVGKAGEYLVCADLILRGLVAYPSEQGLPYDVVADIHGRLLKIQVKTTRKTGPVPQRKNHTAAYKFNINRCGKGGKKGYSEDDFDLMALVALDTKTVAYLPKHLVRKTLYVNPQKFSELTFEVATSL